MKISIITIVYNNRETVADAIESVLGQTYSNIEYIVVDGLSTDGTVSIISSFGNRISRFVSEKDNGLYDAVNKGIGLATGDVIGFLHSDDIFYSQESIAMVAAAFKEFNTDSVYADLLYVQKSDINKVVRNWVSGSYKRESFLFGWMPPHPTFYVKREVYQKFGLYNTQFKSAADYELMLRYLYKYKISTTYIPEKLVKMRIGGKSNVTLKNRIRANQEDYRAWRINNLQPPFYTRFLKPLRKLVQFIYR
ncbi:glycosyltransferase [Pontibacter sp. BT310]|uniref:Glycosyltransferase n=1 Tax=Pontibacter populi TaxID=890055 RepID=A0ABS6XFH3_9BACT|nr:MULTISPECIES: glycosyltransferase family 2 protein [Pontibacter]MBJ6119809.1 glycosyltransferase [Pontibacter sp. BT310]MBR0572238.1 glycosyltransferase [Microvirga sp. STS03]MBW3366662.1 glycosyltransferase [Pontibacter populi]